MWVIVLIIFEIYLQALILNWNVVSLSIVYSNDSLVKSARTSLNSKVVNQYSMLLTPLTAKAVLFIMDAAKLDMVDLCDVKIVKKRGGIVDDTELVKGLVFDKKVSHAARGPTRMENAKIPVIQFQIFPSKSASNKVETWSKMASAKHIPWGNCFFVSIIFLASIFWYY